MIFGNIKKIGIVDDSLYIANKVFLPYMEKWIGDDPNMDIA